jgi:hypothetical protein
MNPSQRFSHSHDSTICRARWENGLALDMFEDQKRVWNVRTAFIQGQYARGTQSKARHRAQDIELKSCWMTIVTRAMNAQNGASRCAVSRHYLQPIDVCGNPSGKPACLYELRTSHVRSNRCLQNIVLQYALNLGALWRDGRHSWSIPACSC